MPASNWRPTRESQISSSVQSLSCVQLFVTPWPAAYQASQSITKSWSLLKFMPIESVMPSNHLILCRPLLLLPSIFPGIRVFSNESVLCIRWPKDWSFSFSISPSSEYSGLIFFRIDWLDLLVVPGTLKNLLQHHSSTEGNKEVISFWWLQGEVKHSPSTVILLWSEDVWREMMAESWESAAKLCPQKVSSWKAWVTMHCPCSLH